MADYNKLKRVYNLKKRAENRYKKAMKYGDGFHTDLYEDSEKDDEKMTRHMNKYHELTNKAEKIFDEHEEKKKKKGNPIKFVAHIGGSDWESFNQKEEKLNNPFNYNEEMASFNMGKFKEQSPNQAFSSKDFDLINNIQGNYKIPSEGNFKTSSQNIYASLDSPLAFKGSNPGFRKSYVKSMAEISDKYSNFALRNEAQALQNASTRQTMKHARDKALLEKGKGLVSILGSFAGLSKP